MIKLADMSNPCSNVLFTAFTVKAVKVKSVFHRRNCLIESIQKSLVEMKFLVKSFVIVFNIERMLLGQRQFYFTDSC